MFTKYAEAKANKVIYDPNIGKGFFKAPRYNMQNRSLFYHSINIK